MRFKSFQIFTISRHLKLSLGKCREIKTTKFITPNSCKASKTKIKSVQIKQIQLSNVLKSRIQTFAIQKNNEQNHNAFKQGHCILSYSQNNFSVQSSFYQFMYSYLSCSPSIPSFPSQYFNVESTLFQRCG